MLVAASGCASRRGVLDVSFYPPTTYVDGSTLAGIESYRVYYATTNVPCPGGPYLTVPAAPGNASRTISTKLTGLRVGELYYVAVTDLTTKGEEIY